MAEPPRAGGAASGSGNGNGQPAAEPPALSEPPAGDRWRWVKAQIRTTDYARLLAAKRDLGKKDMGELLRRVIHDWLERHEEVRH